MSTSPARDEAAVLAELTPIFRRILADDQLVLTPGMTAKDVDGWDSLTHMSLILAVEKQYEVKFKLMDVVKFRNVGDMCRAILSMGR